MLTSPDSRRVPLLFALLTGPLGPRPRSAETMFGINPLGLQLPHR